MRRPIFTVVIPTHNGIDLLERCLAGWAAQGADRGAIEIVVVDNDSDIDPRPACTRWDFANITVIRRPRLRHPFAVASAKNLAMNVARGSWIISCDADCIPAPDYLRVATGVASAHDRPVLATGERVFVSAAGLDATAIAAGTIDFESLERIASASNYGHVRDLRYPDALDLPDTPHPWTHMHGCNTLFSLAAARAVGGYDERYDGNWAHEDIDFAYRLIAQAGCTPLWVPGLVVYHQEPDHPDWRATQRWDRTSNPNWLRLCETIPGYVAFKRRQYRALGLELALPPTPPASIAGTAPGPKKQP